MIKFYINQKLLKYYVEGENKKKFKKILIKFLKKLVKIKNIFIQQRFSFSRSLIKDGFSLPSNFKYKELQKNLIYQKIY
jgi:hypothetical protein